MAFKHESYYASIIDLIQERVDTYIKEAYKSDSCPPQCTISVLMEDLEHHQIILTITHSNQSFSHVLFPRKDSFYGYESIFSLIDNAYNQTM